MCSINYNMIRHIYPVSSDAVLLMFLPILYKRLTMDTSTESLCGGGRVLALVSLNFSLDLDDVLVFPAVYDADATLQLDGLVDYL